jgi:hypothetical protein
MKGTKAVFELKSKASIFRAALRTRPFSGRQISEDGNGPLPGVIPSGVITAARLAS